MPPRGALTVVQIAALKHGIAGLTLPPKTGAALAESGAQHRTLVMSAAMIRCANRFMGKL